MSSPASSRRAISPPLRSITIDQALLKVSPAGREAAAASIVALMQATAGEIAESLESAPRRPPTTAAVHIGKSGAHLTPEAHAEFFKRLNELLDEFTDKYGTQRRGTQPRPLRRLLPGQRGARRMSEAKSLSTRAVLRVPDFRSLFVGQTISDFGDAMTSLALLLVVNKLTGSTAALALMAIALALPQVTVGVIAGVYVDRWDRRRVMLVSDLLRAGSFSASCSSNRSIRSGCSTCWPLRRRRSARSSRRRGRHSFLRSCPATG